MQIEAWAATVITAAGIISTYLLTNKKQNADDRSESFKELEALKDEYKYRLEKVELQQMENTKQINNLVAQERDCQKTVGVLNERVNHLSKQNDQLLDILKNYDFRKSDPGAGTGQLN
jgi:chromosome segregation ATPase